MAQLRRGARAWIDHTQQDIAEAMALLNAAIGTIKLNPFLCQDHIEETKTLLQRIAYRIPELEEMLQRAEQSHQTTTLLHRINALEKRMDEIERAPLGDGAHHLETFTWGE